MNSTECDALIDALVCYQLFARRTILAYRNGLTKEQAMVVSALSSSEAMSMKELSARLAIAKEQTTRAVSYLENEGLISRKHSQGDKRTVEVGLTEKGRAFFAGQREEVGKMIEECLEDLNESETESLVDAARTSCVLLTKALGIHSPSAPDGADRTSAPGAKAGEDGRALGAR